MPVGEESYQSAKSQIQDHFRQLPSHSLTAPSQTPQFVHSPDPKGIPINYQSHNYNSRFRFTGFPNSGGNFSVSENDSAVQLSADRSNLTPLKDLDFQLMNIDQNMSPSSGITSPMDLGFTNIGDEQSIDNIDLNNITPSIKLASSLTLLGPSEFSSGNGTGSANGSNPRQSGGGEGGGGNFEENEMPSASCPVENSGATYLASRSGASGPFESPTGTLNIPRPGGAAGGGGTASGGSGASSVTGTWGGSSLASLSGAPNIAVVPCNPTAGADNQRVAMMRARSKKDSHNRIERKRRDYINCQIAELGNLLPEEMFRENDCKKNKGTILKNSVEYITVLQKENQCYNSLFNETNLANTLIDRMVKRIQTLESILPPEYLAKVASEGVADYRTILQEWSKVHEMNHQKISSGTNASTGAAGVSFDTSESSPGMSSVGNNEDGSYLEARGDSNSPVPLVSRSERTRCTSASSGTGQSLAMGSASGILDSGPLGGPSVVGSLPSRGARILPATSPPNPGPPQVGSRLHQMRPIFSPSLKHPSTPSGRMTGKRTAAGRPPPTKMEDNAVGIPVPKQSPVFSPSGGNTFGNSGGGPFAGLSISLPVRMASDEFPGAAEMNTDESYLQMTSEGRESSSGCQDIMAIPGAFKPDPMAEISCNPPSNTTLFHSHSYQPPLFGVGGSVGLGGAGGGGCGGSVPPIWPRLQRPLSAGQHQHQAPTSVADTASPSHQPMADELQFDHAI